MWRTDLIVSKYQSILVSIFYINLGIILIFMLHNTYIDSFIFVILILLVFEWWRACCYFRTMKGELALFYQSNELYWSKQRWYITKSPLFLHHAVIIHLVSKRNGKKRILFVMNDSFSRQDWRSFNYFLRQFMC